VTNWSGSHEARVTNWPPLAVTAIGMWVYMPVQITGILVYIFVLFCHWLSLKAVAAKQLHQVLELRCC